MMSLVWKYLKQQKKRTILTILGIVLAAALVASVGIFFSSFRNMMLAQATYSSGTHDATFSAYSTEDLSDDIIQKIADNYLVEKSGLSYGAACLRYANQDGTQQDIIIEQYDQNALSFHPKELKEGRLPQNANEILIPSTYSYLGKVGDTVTGPLLFPEMDEKNEQMELKENGESSFTIVGVYSSKNRWGSIVTGGILPGNTKDMVATQYVSFKPGMNKQTAMETLLKDTGLSIGEDLRADLNDGYLTWKGEGGTSGMQRSINLTLLLLAVIILAAMASVIRNSFAMSVSEKMAQFGALRCVGASPRQIRRLVIEEAFITWLIAIPLGLLLGVGAMSVTFSVVQGIDLEALQYFHLVLEPGPLVLTIVFSLAAVLLSAWAPAKSASKISAIEAVRGSLVFQDSTTNGRGGTLLGQLFGFTGSLAGKNIRRNKKRYRTTVFSVTLSIALFICIGGFGQKMIDSITMFSDVHGTDFVFRYTTDADFPEKYNDFEVLKSQIEREPGLAGIELLAFTEMEMLIPDAKISPEFSKLGKTGGETLTDRNGKPQVPVTGSLQRVEVYFVTKETYNALKRSENSPSYEELTASKGILFNPTATISSLDSGMTAYPVANFEKGDSVWFQGHYGNETENDEGKSIPISFQMPIEGFVEKTPWYETSRFRPQVFIPLENRSLFIEQQGKVNYTENISLFVKAEQEQKESVNQRIKEYETGYFYLNNIYESEKENRNTAVVLNIFVYGFLSVVIIICSLNLFNTIHANLQMRKREIAMLRAVGMDNKKLWKTLLLECILYGVIGTIWGAILGFSLQIMLSYAVMGAIEVEILSSPIIYIGASFLASVAVCLLAGVGPIRRLIKGSIVEEIRAQE